MVMRQTLEFNHKKQCGLWLMLIGYENRIEENLIKENLTEEKSGEDSEQKK